MRILLAQNVCYLVSKVTEKMINKAEGESELDVWNGAAGIDIKRVGLAHSIYYTFDTFREAVFQVKH